MHDSPNTGLNVVKLIIFQKSIFDLFLKVCVQFYTTEVINLISGFLGLFDFERSVVLLLFGDNP